MDQRHRRASAGSHHWWYFREMTPQHVLLLKTYESETDGRARFLGHSAFEDPNTPPDAPTRESIEADCRQRRPERPLRHRAGRAILLPMSLKEPTHLARSWRRLR
jgi:hypothetical protein